MQIDKQLQELVTRATTALGDQLQSLVLYGSAARNEFDSGHSDLNILLLAARLDVDVLNRSASLLEWWRAQGNPQPLLFTLDELRSATDAFPIEIYDIRDCHRILYGSDPLPELVIDNHYHRAQLEHELRSKLLRLRQKAIPVLKTPKALLRLMEDSVSTFLIMIRHVMLVKGLTPPASRRELLAAAHSANVIQPLCFAQLIDLREGKLSPKAVDSVQLFEDYLKQIQTLVASVDAL